MENRKWAVSRRLLGPAMLIAAAGVLTAAHSPLPATRAPAIFHSPPSALRLTIARLQYDGGGDWYANPSSIPNLLQAIRERTSLKVEPTEARVSLKDDRLWDHPFLHVTEIGRAHV